MNRPIKELRRICQDTKTEKEDWYSTNFCRKVSIYLTKLLLFTSITANQVTLLSIVVGLVAGVLFSFGNYLYTLVGALLLQLWLIFDCIDGEIARYRKSANISGKYVESMNHHIVHPIIFWCISLGLYNILQNFFILILGFLVALFMCLGSIAANFVYIVLVKKTSDLQEKIVSEQISKIKKDIRKKHPKMRRIYNYVRAPFAPFLFVLMILIAATTDLLFINLCPNFAIGALHIEFGPDITISLHNILNKMNFNILYIYFLLFTIISILRNIIGIFDYFSQLKSVE